MEIQNYQYPLACHVPSLSGLIPARGGYDYSANAVMHIQHIGLGKIVSTALGEAHNFISDRGVKASVRWNDNFSEIICTEVYRED